MLLVMQVNLWCTVRREIGDVLSQKTLEGVWGREGRAGVVYGEDDYRMKFVKVGIVYGRGLREGRSIVLLSAPCAMR